MPKKNDKCKYTSIGGQAVIEGIMMRGPKKSALSVRLNDGSILTEEVEMNQLKEKYKVLGLPVLRGVASFIEAIVYGYKILMRSAELAMTEDDDEISENAKDETVESAEEALNVEEAEVKSIKPDDSQKNDKEKDSSFILTIISVISTILGIGLALFIFFWVPTQLFNMIEKAVGKGIHFYRPLVEGTMKLILFLAYIYLVSLMKEIKRVFSYHGAEHKTIFCYEANEELTVENVRKYKRFHPRCGTSFMFLMILVGILVSTAVIIIFPGISKISIVWVLFKIAMVPLFCGFGYELIKFCGRHDNLLTKIISAPGLWVQRLTTKEPDDGMIEVAIAALKEVIPENNEDKLN